MTLEWKGLPGPESIDPDDRTWTMTAEEYLAFLELLEGEKNGRIRLERYKRYVCKAAGLAFGAYLQIVVEPPHLNS